MDPSSPPVKRTLHLLKTPDILLANDSRPTGNYSLSIDHFAISGWPTILPRNTFLWDNRVTIQFEELDAGFNFASVQI
jgi:hypothetical protein